MDPTTASTDATESLASLLDEQQELGAPADRARQIIEERIECLREAVDRAPDELIVACERTLRRVHTLAEIRERAEFALKPGRPNRDQVLRLLRAALQEGSYLNMLDEEIRFEVPVETLDRYATMFQRLMDRPFDPRRDSISWDEAGDENDPR